MIRSHFIRIGNILVVEEAPPLLLEVEDVEKIEDGNELEVPIRNVSQCRV